MERNVDILRRDARAPLCVEALPRWRYERAFRKVLSGFLPEGAALLEQGVTFLTSHHVLSQDFVSAVDSVIVDPALTAAKVRSVFVRLLETTRALEDLRTWEGVVEQLREKLAERYPTEGGTLPEFEWEKGAAELFLGRVKRTAVSLAEREERLAAHLSDVYDDCARTLQLGLWIIASPWRPAVVDAWLFESAYPFFRHTVPSHLAGPGGLVALLSDLLDTLISAQG